MSAWIVYSKDGSVERCELKALEYGGTAMGERAVTATFHHHSEVDFEVFDYIEYRGDKFELEAVPTVKKVSSFEYIYELRFVSLKYELERCEMRDLVPYDNEVVYPTPLTFSFTGNVRYLTERIQACLDALYGSGTWNIIIADGVESEEKNITIAQQNCWNALALVSSTYGLSFYIKGRTITIGGEQPLVGHTFEYGKGNGLYEIERASDTNTGIVTKLRAYGGTRNLDYSYPKRPEWSDSALPVSFAFSPLRLMLPSFKTDGKTDYVLADSATIAKYGIREASMVYDDIYPSITGATYNGQAIDEIKSVEDVDDNARTFVVHLHDLGFDLEEHLTNADAQISMKTGAMQGYIFTMSVIEKQEDGSYKITLGRISAEGGDNYNIPNSDWNMKAGDKFVLLNILMPQMYIREAEDRLKERAEEYLAQYGKTNFSYNIGLHDKFLIENPSVYASLIEGSKLRVRDAEIGIDEEVTIQSIAITENAEDNILPQVKVTLNNEPSASTLERIQGRIDALANETAAGNFATQSEIMAQYRKKLDKPYFDKLFVAVDAEGNEIASNDITTPVAYIKAKYDFAVVGGVTMYATDKDLDIPDIYDGLPIDWDTLYWVLDEKGKKLHLKAKGGEGNGTFGDIETLGEGNAITKVEIIKGGEADKLVFTKEKTFIDKNYLEENCYTKTYIDKTFITKSGAADLFVTVDDTPQDIDGEKNFIGSLMVNGMPIVYDYRGFWKLEGDLLVTGGIASFSSDTRYTPSTVMDGIVCDESTISADGGFLHFVGEIKGGISNVIPDGNGNAVTSLVLSSDGESVTYYKGMTFAEKKYVDDNFSQKTYVDETFVTLKGDPQTIESQKNFIGGLQVNGNPIVYNSEEGYWMLDGDLLVTGDITSFANEDGYTPSSIMDALRVDETNLKVIDGVLTFVGSTGGSGGVAGKVTWANIEGKPTWIGESKPSYSWTEITGKPSWIGSSKPSYSWSEITGKPNFVTEEDLEEEGFLTAMDIQVLTFTSGTFKAVSYDPSMSPCTVNIPTKLSHLEDDSDFVTYDMMSVYATKTWVGKQGFLDSSDLNGYATEPWVGNNYLPLTGSLPASMDGEFKLQGDLRLRDGTEYYGRQLFFGDGDYCYIGELSDDKMMIYGDKGIVIKTNTSSSTKYYIELTTEGIKLNGGIITYNGSYWEINGDVLVTGGITSYE